VLLLSFNQDYHYHKQRLVLFSISSKRLMGVESGFVNEYRCRLAASQAFAVMPLCTNKLQLYHRLPTEAVIVYQSSAIKYWLS